MKRSRRIGGRLAALLLTTALAGGMWAGAAEAESLTEAMATVYATNPNLLAARAELRAANEAVPQALSNWRPTVQVFADAGVQRIESDTGTASGDPETTNPRDVALQVVQPLYRGGRTEAQTAAAEYSVLAQRARLVSVEQTVLLAAAISYMNVWQDEAVLRLNINNEQVLARQLEASQDRFQVGEITRTDVAQSESRLAGATAARIDAEGQLQRSRATYVEVIGHPPGELSPPGDVPGLPAGLDEAVVQARTNNPQVIASDYSSRAAERTVRLVFGELLPEVALAGTLSHSAESNFDDTEVNRAQLLAQVTVPIYQAGFVSSRVREAKQIESQRRLEYDQSLRLAEREAVGAWEVLVSARAAIISLESQVKASEIALEGVRQENQVGARTTLDVLDAEQELLDAQVSLVAAQRDEVVARFQLLASIGRLTAQDLALPVDVYDPTEDYRAVRDRWFGLSAPGQSGKGQ